MRRKYDKLTRKMMEEIRSHFRLTGENGSIIAERFNISIPKVSQVLTGCVINTNHAPRQSDQSVQTEEEMLDSWRDVTDVDSIRFINGLKIGLDQPSEYIF